MFDVTSFVSCLVEKKLPLLMEVINSLGDDEKLKKVQKEWRRIVHQIAIESYSLACGNDTPRKIMAFALGMKHLELFRYKENIKNYQYKDIEEKISEEG